MLCEISHQSKNCLNAQTKQQQEEQQQRQDQGQARNPNDIIRRRIQFYVCVNVFVYKCLASHLFPVLLSANKATTTLTNASQIGQKVGSFVYKQWERQS